MRWDGFYALFYKILHYKIDRVLNLNSSIEKDIDHIKSVLNNYLRIYREKENNTDIKL